MNSLRIGGFVPLSTVDYPGELACVVFAQGCPWRCAYCQNEHLLAAHSDYPYDWPHVLEFLRGRQGLLDAVVFSGGEPLAQSALLAAVRAVHALGFKIGLHTGGAYPPALEKILPYCSWIALDVKALEEDYAALTGAENAGRKVSRSLNLLQQSGITFEVRTTVHRHLLPDDQLCTLAQRLCAMGVRHYALQTCETRQGRARELPLNTLDEDWRSLVAKSIAPLFPRFELRMS